MLFILSKADMKLVLRYQVLLLSGELTGSILFDESSD